MAKNKDGISLIDNHDYMTIKTGNWSFTMSYSGEKANGTLVKAAGIFEKICDFMKDFKVKNPGTKNGDAMRALGTKATLDVLWPGWNAAGPVISVGEMVRIPDFAKKYPGEYEVVEVKRTNAFLRISDKETIGFQKHELVVTGKKQPAA
jgi:hypothetical protein